MCSSLIAACSKSLLVDNTLLSADSKSLSADTEWVSVGSGPRLVGSRPCLRRLDNRGCTSSLLRCLQRSAAPSQTERSEQVSSFDSPFSIIGTLNPSSYTGPLAIARYGAEVRSSDQVKRGRLRELYQDSGMPWQVTLVHAAVVNFIRIRSIQADIQLLAKARNSSSLSIWTPNC